MRKSEKTRQFIIAQSAAIINKKGVAGTAISDLMDATKLAKGGIYGNFENKEEICVEAFNHLTAIISAGLDKAAAAKSTPKDKLFAILDYYVEHHTTTQLGGCPLLNFGMEADDTNPKLRMMVAKAAKRSQQRFSKLIEEGQRHGNFSKKADPELFAMKMFTMIEGGIFLTRVSGNKSTMKTVIDILKKEIDAL